MVVSTLALNTSLSRHTSSSSANAFSSLAVPSSGALARAPNGVLQADGKRVRWPAKPALGETAANFSKAVRHNLIGTLILFCRVDGGDLQSISSPPAKNTVFNLLARKCTVVRKSGVHIDCLQNLRKCETSVATQRVCSFAKTTSSFRPQANPSCCPHVRARTRPSDWTVASRRER